jgi:energy-coupling factor transport system permease protein
MEDFELTRQITIGQYLPTGSWLHRLDPRVKIVGIGLLIMAVVALRSLGALAAALALIVACVRLARIPLGLAAANLRPAVPVLLFLAALQILFGWGAQDACLDLWRGAIFGLALRVNVCALAAALAMLLRLGGLVLLVALLTMAATISELTHGAESLMRPLRRIGLPAHELALTFTLALRFAPTLAEELEKLLKAQASRGADIRLGSNPVQRVRHFLPVLVPLFVNTLQRGEALAEAMEARGYTGGAGRTQYIELGFNRTDALALALAALLVVLLFVINYFMII